MAVVLVVAQLKGHRRLEPLVAVRRHAHAHGHLVRDGEGHAAGLAGEEVGVLPHLLQRRVAVLPPQLHRQNGRQLVLGQKGHQPPQSHVLAVVFGDLLGLAGGDALQGGEPLRLPLQDVQCLRPEPLHDPPGGGRAHAFADAGGQIAEDLLLILRQAPLQLHHPDLLPMLGVGLPSAGDRQMLPRRHAGDAAHHGDHLALLRQEAQDRIAVFGVLKNDAMYRTLTGDQLFHVLPLSYGCVRPGR